MPPKKQTGKSETDRPVQIGVGPLDDSNPDLAEGSKTNATSPAKKQPESGKAQTKANPKEPGKAEGQ